MKKLLLTVMTLTIVFATSAQIITTVAGVGGYGSYTGGALPATSTSIEGTNAVYVDDTGNIYLATNLGGQSGIAKINTNGILSTVYNNVGGSPSLNMLSGTGISGSTLGGICGLAVDDSGNIYTIVWTSDPTLPTTTNYYSIVKWSSTTGSYVLYAGNTVSGYLDGYRTSAKFNQPSALAIDAANNLYVADEANHVIRKIDHVSGMVTTVAGNYALGGGHSGDGGSATAAQLAAPVGVAIDGLNNIYIIGNLHYVRKVTASTGIISTIAGNGSGIIGGGRWGPSDCIRDE